LEALAFQLKRKSLKISEIGVYMKVLLGTLNAKFVHSNLAIRYLKAYANNFDIELFETSINDNLMDTAMNIIDKLPDVIAFSCYIWNIEATLKVASSIKEVLPGAIILLGGPEVSYDGGEYLKKYDFIDYIAQGEGEIIFKSFLEVINHPEKSFDCVNGLIYRSNFKIIENKCNGSLEKLDNIPFPYEENIPDKIVYYEASRGCPFSCTYCLSGSAGGVRYFSIERVKKDLKILIDNKVELVKFVDRTFNSNRKFAYSIWEFLIENHCNTKFHFEIGADLLDEESIKLLNTAPKELFQFEVGIQTTNIEVLKNINRIMDYQRIKENIIKIKESDNIHCHLDLIAGLPGENIDSFKNSFDMCMEINPEVLQLGFLKVLKGTTIYKEKEKYGIHYIKHPNYQVLYTDNLPYPQMRELIDMEKSFEIYYNSGIFNITLSYIFTFYKSKFDFFMELTGFLKQTDFYNRNVDLKDKFKLLYEFGSLKCGEVIKDIMLHEYIINTRKTVLPEFLRRDYPKNLKEQLHINKSKIIDNFGEFDIKKLFVTPVSVEILKCKDEYVVEEKMRVAVFNLASGRYCYI
jgi:radical SAM superfamily enzyme YgiQ (UPF0313 family)